MHYNGWAGIVKFLRVAAQTAGLTAIAVNRTISVWMICCNMFDVLYKARRG